MLRVAGARGSRLANRNAVALPTTYARVAPGRRICLNRGNAKVDPATEEVGIMHKVISATPPGRELP